MPVIEQKTTNKNKVDFDLNRLDKSKTTIFSKYPKKITDPVCPKTHSYVVTIVEHQAIDQYRRLQKHPSVELIEEIQGTNAHYEGDNDLTKCILKLPARYREMILLRYHHGYTVREIAKVLGLSLPTAIKLDQRAKSRLKKMCEEEGIL